MVNNNITTRSASIVINDVSTQDQQAANGDYS